MWPFKRKQESPQEIAAEKLDEVTREVAWDEFGKEAVREQRRPSNFVAARSAGAKGDPVRRRRPRPRRRAGLRDALRATRRPRPPAA